MFNDKNFGTYIIINLIIINQRGILDANLDAQFSADIRCTWPARPKHGRSMAPLAPFSRATTTGRGRGLDPLSTPISGIECVRRGPGVN